MKKPPIFFKELKYYSCLLQASILCHCKNGQSRGKKIFCPVFMQYFISFVSILQSVRLYSCISIIVNYALFSAGYTIFDIYSNSQKLQVLPIKMMKYGIKNACNLLILLNPTEFWDHSL